jgi:hypothetical protein
MRVASFRHMTRGRRAKPYKEGPRKQMTLAWKRHVIATLGANKKAGRKPANLAQLAATLKADKRGIYVTFDLELEPPQMSSAYVDEICELLDIAPPMFETSGDDEVERDLDVVRALSTEDRRALMEVAQRMLTKPR